MRRVIVLHKVFWVGRHTKDEYKVLKNLSDSALENVLNDMNKPYPKWKWEVIGDYNLAKRKDRNAYAEYCLKCAADLYCKDEYSKAVGNTMLYSLDKKVNEED